MVGQVQKPVDVSRAKPGALALALADADIGAESIYHFGDYASGPHKADALKLAENGACEIFQRPKSSPHWKLRKFYYVARKTKKLEWREH